jgi:hypothetical protein
LLHLPEHVFTVDQEIDIDDDNNNDDPRLAVLNLNLPTTGPRRGT